MFLNYLKIAIRNLKKNKGYSFINIFGLAVGLACCILILLYIKNELSYDHYNKNINQIYRVRLSAKIGNHEMNLATSCAPCGPTFTREIPGVVNFTRIRNYEYPLIRYKDKAFSEEKFYWVDSKFFDVFTIPFIEGDPKTALNQPNSVVITESTAKKYFGNEDPMGKILNADKHVDYIVTGVIKDFPQNSSFHFDFLGSLSHYKVWNDQSWLGDNYYTYLLVKKGTNINELEKKIYEITKTYASPQLQKAIGVTYDQFLAGGSQYKYILQPLSDIHLRSHLSLEIEPNGDITYIYIFSLIAFAILLIGCINFMNLSTARSSGRGKEVGIRKTLGSSQGLLIRQFLTETILMSFIAMILAILLVELFLPTFNFIAGKDLALHIFNNFYTLPLLIGFTLVVGLIAGIYPSFVLSSFIPVKVLRGSSKKSSSSAWLRNTLVITQFSISIILIVGAFIIKSQLNYIQNKKLGFDRDQILIIKNAGDIGKDIQSFKNDLMQNSSIIDATNSVSVPGGHFNETAHKRNGAGPGDVKDIMYLYTDYNFVNTYKIKMKEGRFFSKTFASDTTAVVLNEEAVKALGLKNPIGKYIVRVGETPGTTLKFKVIGVTDDFNFESLHQKIEPLIINLFGQGGFGMFVSIRFAPKNVKSTIQYISSVWQKYAGNQAFSYSFFNDDFAKLYASEQRTGQIFSVFSILAIFIACLGLLGLAAYTAELRTKEIGIRKVLGATVPEIVFMLTKEFTKWVIISNIIAWPIAYYFTNNWLQNFAYRINIGIWIFILSGVCALLIAIITVGYQAIRAATANPVKSLRYE
jgi:putative ABC transport system permease protein